MNYNLNFGTSVILNVPLEKFDLADWIVNFSCEEYVSCTPASRSHRYSGLYRDADGDFVIRNDEYCGGFMMTQFYRPRVMEPDHVRLESRTKARFLQVWPIIFPLYWDLRLESVNPGQTLFHCRIGASLPWIYFLASKLIRLQFWSQQHADEETPHFAHYAARWATRQDTDQPTRFWLS
ncbi:hypothetical protein [Synechococcus sp. EJ6-Ellesmere]|nr:hypothetical protein [Synechococcus sp. EJ6-Ellesmere]MCP9826081.1 hypothetical protein [Synechococcus sp. EJ6-Ellesmere]